MRFLILKITGAEENKVYIPEELLEFELKPFPNPIRFFGTERGAENYIIEHGAINGNYTILEVK